MVEKRTHFCLLQIFHEILNRIHAFKVFHLLMCQWYGFYGNCLYLWHSHPHTHTHTHKRWHESSSSSSQNVTLCGETMVLNFPHTPHSRNSIRGEWMDISPRELSMSVKNPCGCCTNTTLEGIFMTILYEWNVLVRVHHCWNHHRRHHHAHHQVCNVWHMRVHISVSCVYVRAWIGEYNSISVTVAF